ncbi:MAG: hypothetical protein RI940_351 [Bacteroidota bacterium]|jgi:hypothetical protein
MKKITLLLALSTALMLQSFAQKASWKSLFNGKDLNNWVLYNGHANYRIEKDEIVGTTVYGEPNSFLSTKELYGDFILELDYKVNDTMNSGIQIRSELHDANDKCEVTDKKTPNRVHGFQIEIDPSSRGWAAGIYDEARRDWVYPLSFNEKARTAFKHNDWNHVRVEAIGTHVRTWLNGVPCAHVVDDMTLKGFISLQVHQIEKPNQAGEEIRWKNIRIQTENLKPSAPDNIFVANLIPNNLSDAEIALGYKLLFDGVSTKGWKSPYNKDFPANTWSVKNGELSVSAGGAGPSFSNGGDIVTEEKYKAFDLQFEFKLTDTANSGVKYFVTDPAENKGAALGLEYQILDDDKHPDAKQGTAENRTNASLYDLIPALRIGSYRREKFPIGKWNRGRIIAFTDGKVEHWINGWKVIEYQRGTQYFKALIARSKYASYPNFGMAESGRILLQEHGTNVSYRSIKIKELK